MAFAQLACAWYIHQAGRWSTVHTVDVLASLEGDAFPMLRKLPIGAIDARTILNVLNEVERRGCLTTAKRMRQRLSSIFRFGIMNVHYTDDPAAIISRMPMPARPPRPHTALLTIEECILQHPLNKLMRAERDDIDLAQTHSPKNKVEAADTERDA